MAPWEQRARSACREKSSPPARLLPGGQRDAGPIFMKFVLPILHWEKRLRCQETEQVVNGFRRLVGIGMGQVIGF